MKRSDLALVLAVGFAVLGARRGFAAETDNFTYRFLTLEDSAPKLNEVFNTSLSHIAEQTNDRLRAKLAEPAGASDTEVELTFVETYRDNVLKRFGDRVLPVFGACIERNDCPGWAKFQRIALTREEGIYGQSHYNRVAIAFLAPSINLCGVRVGTDKLTHLFSNGFFYYNASRQKRSKIAGEQDVYRMAIADEWGLMGARSTAVVSPADAQASLGGYRLARDYFEGENPVFARDDKTGLLVKLRDVDVCAYVSEKWDEVLNPSIFTARRGKVQKLRAAIEQRVAANQRDEKSMSEDKKRAFQERILNRPPEAAHGRLPWMYRLYLVFKYAVAYLTISRESREGIRSIMFPGLKLKDRRPIVLKRSRQDDPSRDQPGHPARNIAGPVLLPRRP